MTAKALQELRKIDAILRTAKFVLRDLDAILRTVKFVLRDLYEDEEERRSDISEKDSALYEDVCDNCDLLGQALSSVDVALACVVALTEGQ